MSQGIRIGNFQGARDSTVNVRMSGNLLWGQKQGRLIVDNGAEESTINVFSFGNRFFSNGAGTIIAGGLSQNNTEADGNTINFEAFGDQFVGNTNATEFDHGGLVVLGLENVSPATGGGSNNTVNIALWGCRMSDNELSDLYGVGARSNFGATPADPSLSQNNHVTIVMLGDGNGRSQPVEFFAHSLPGPPNYGNSVTVIDFSHLRPCRFGKCF